MDRMDKKPWRGYNFFFLYFYVINYNNNKEMKNIEFSSAPEWGKRLVRQ